jgi:heptosyltransferase-1
MAEKCKKSRSHPASIETAALKLAGGWSGQVALVDSSGNRFGVEDWASCLAEITSLCGHGDRIIKSDAGTVVSVHSLNISDKIFPVVIKTQDMQPGLRNLGRSLLPARAIRNFRTAMRLYRSNVPVARPLAALSQKTGPFTIQSIYITEYIQNCGNLHTFLRDNASPVSSANAALKRELCGQIASIFASLHNASLWHRDAKASNFLVHLDRNGRYVITLVDMDGIKPYGFRPGGVRFRCLAKLAATLLWHRAINTTDYLRTFTIYSNLTGLVRSERLRIFRTLAHRAVAIRLITLAKAAMESTNAKQGKKRILIIKPSALGDIVLALPALASLRASFPDAKISWFVRSECAPLFDSVGGVDDIILFERKLLGKWWYNPKAFAALVRLISRLRRGKFDIVIDLQGLFRTALFAWLAGCKKRLGMAESREFAGLFYTHKIAQDNDSVHLIDYYQKIVSAAGASAKSCEFNLTPTKRTVDSVKGLLTEHGIGSDRYAVFVPGSAHAFKCWPVQNFAALAEKVTSTFDLPIIAVGTSAEKDVVQILKSASNVPITDLAGLTDIPQLTALLGGAKIVVSNDTGPGHIAAALGVPVVLIFGSTNPARIRPYGRTNAVAAIELESRGREIESSDPRHAIENITVEHVFKKVTYQLQHY